MIKTQKILMCIMVILLSFMGSTYNNVFSDSPNMIVNGDFSQGTSGWTLFTQYGGEAAISVANKELHVNIRISGNEKHSVGVNQIGLKIEQNVSYTVAFSARSESGNRNIYVKIGLAKAPWTFYSQFECFFISTEKKKYSFQFTMHKPTDTNAHLEFQMGTNDIDVYLDDIVVTRTGDNDDENVLSGSQTFELGRFKVILGKQETLLKNGRFNLHHFPDNCISVIETSPKYRVIMAAGISTFLLEGKSLKKLTSCKLVLEPGKKGDFDNGYAGIGGVYRGKDNKLYGFYHAEDQEGMPKFPDTNIPGFHASIGLAVSENNGKTWKKVGQIVTSSKPKGWKLYEEQVESGLGILCSTLSKDKRYLYIYYSEHSRVDANGNWRGVQICMARVDLQKDLPLPGKWYKYFKGKFNEPGIGGRDSVVMSAKHMDDAEAINPHVVFSEYLGFYIMVLNIDFWKEVVNNTGLERCGMYLAYSSDGINWSKPTMLIKDWPIPLMGKSISWQPTLIFDEGSTKEGWLVYAYSEKFGHEHQGGIPHYMVGRRFKFEK